VIAATWLIAGLATAGVITRPMRSPEWVWAIGGAILLLLFGLIAPTDAGRAVAKGLDVYLFLTGIMLLSEVARAHGVFDWAATLAVNHARGSTSRLFLLIYATGTLVTALMSNDATAVVLTPAVFAAARKARADPLPMLFACAMVANAASFVLPISNPANLVLYGGHMPPLGGWFRSFALPSVAAIVVTYGVLRVVERRRLAGACAAGIAREPLSAGGRLSLAGVLLTAALLIVISALDEPLGLPTAVAGVATALGVSLLRRQSPLALVRHVSWGVLPLVAGLFVLVDALNSMGAIAQVALWLRQAGRAPGGAAAAGTALAFLCNAINNLPAGLLAGTALSQAQPTRLLTDALLIGVDLGPNLSVTGSLATILWLQAIRREGEDVSFLGFLRVGIIAMPLALAAALGTRLLIG
jgi:arsenical pump membrane protein